ncbi:AAA-like domain-containing protein [Nostoc commune]|uniref:AAA-like domain-containing protein n=1 Tax=Nostoc commune TaxID=1178 RepID=UPI0018C577F6|nr:AAA-like domain-containing protein [Nostoc commune]MBG1261358.1 hypothetical protein [Nostoc commune BAE]
MEFSEALNIINQATFTYRKQYLTDLQINVFQGAWEGKSYEDIATQLQYTYKYISQQVGPQLWNILSQALGEPVSKTNFRAAVERRAQLLYEEILSANSEFVEHQQRLAELPLHPSEPELPIGQVPLNSAFYVERPPVEDRCYQEILQPGALIRIKAPKLMGKTSLMARIMHYAKEHGYQIVPLSFDLADNAAFTNLDTFLRWFCESVGRKLKRIEQLDDYWTMYGSKDKTTAYFEECLLEQITTPLVIALDEVHRIFPYRDIADDFFSLLRAWYEYARYGDSNSEVWQQLRVILVHSKEVYIPLHINQSPFNIGLSIELQEFNTEQVQGLVTRYKGLNWTTTQVEKLMEMVGGHPYLIRQALYYIQYQGITLEQLLQTAPEEPGIYSDHLRRQLGNLKQHPDLAAAFKQVVTTPEAVELNSDLVFKLHSMGLVVHRPENKVTWRCELYRQYFYNRLGLD